MKCTILNRYLITSMHSSRMRTVLCSGRRGGDVCCGGGGWCLLWEVSAVGGVCRGVSAQGGVCQGVSAPVHAGIHTPVNRITDACENITLPQLRCRR